MNLHQWIFIIIHILKTFLYNINNHRSQHIIIIQFQILKVSLHLFLAQIEDVNSCSSRTLHSLHGACPWWCHGLWILQIRHHHCRYRQHEAAEDLLGVFADTWIGKADARAVKRHPGAPFQSHHQAAHAEDHSYNVHVVWRQVVLHLSLIIWTWWLVTDFLFRSPGICRVIHLENLQYNAQNNSLLDLPIKKNLIICN